MLRTLLTRLFRRRQVENELHEEVEGYFEILIERYMERGLSREEAVRAARVQFEGQEQVKEKVRDARMGAGLETILRDLRYAARVLRKSPGFTAMAVLTLTLGIGANTAVFSLMDVLLIRPLAVPHADELRLLNISGKRYSFNYPLVRQIEERNSVFSGMATWSSHMVQVREESDLKLIPAVYASGGYFTTLGAASAAGRVFGPDDDRELGGKNGPVAVISDGFWERKFARSASAIGKVLVINGIAVSVIGIMPAGFFGTEVGTSADIWLPLNLARQTGDESTCFASSTCWFLQVIGRLKPGVSGEQANAGLKVISRPSMEAVIKPDMRADRKATYLSFVVESEPGKSGYSALRSRVKNPLRILMGLVALVLLIACANMANLLSARASSRAREVSVRLAMGAGRGRVIRQFLTESLLLSAAGAAGGMLFALWSTRLLVSVLSTVDDPVQLDLQPDWRVFAFSAAVTMAAGVLFGIWPAFRATRHGLAAALKERGHQVRSGRPGFGLGRALLSFQIAISVVLLAAAGLFAFTLIRLATINPGFEPDRLTVISMVNSRPPLTGAPAADRFGRLMRRAATLPGVESATLLSTTPLTNSGWNDVFEVPGRSDLSEDQRVLNLNAVGTHFTATMRVPLLAGRDVNDGDTAQSDKVLLISENAARLWFPKGDALGASVHLTNEPPCRIIGIVGNSLYWNLKEEMPMNGYVPYTQSNEGRYIALRTQAKVNATYAAFQQVMREEAPGMPIGSIRTMNQQIEESLATERLTAYISVFIGVLALLLTSVGLYGVLAYGVTQRTGEIGIRMALGAQRPAVVWLVVREAMWQTGVGLMMGVAVVLSASRLLRAMLFGVQPNDPATIGVTVVILLVVCAAAAALPAHRATRLDPMRALREE